jgi:hypothetical protein
MGGQGLMRRLQITYTSSSFAFVPRATTPRHRQLQGSDVCRVVVTDIFGRFKIFPVGRRGTGKFVSLYDRDIII